MFETGPIKRALIQALILPLLLAAGPVGKTAPPATKSDLPPKPPERERTPTIFKDADQFHSLIIASDASGSMIQKMATLKDQINKTIVGLSPEQSFGEVFFKFEDWSQFNEKLLPATPDQKKAAGQFLEDVITSGETTPIPGIEAAFRLNPEVIYLVADGDFPDNAAVLKRVRELNKDKKVKIYTIAFVTASDSDTSFIDLLKTIASENGGKYAHVNEEDV